MSYKLPVSIKGILINSKQQVLLMKNERNTWELPGGRIEPEEQPKETLERELLEETSIRATVLRIIDAYVFEVIPDRKVFIVAFQCSFDEDQDIILSDEHVEAEWIDCDKLEHINIAEGYRESIKKALIK